MQPIATVKELKAFLEKFDDRDEIQIPCYGTKGVGFDQVKGYILIDNYGYPRRISLRN